MTALATYDRADLVGRAWIELMAPAVELAKAIAGTEFVPKGLRNNPAAVAAAILYGDEIGVGPLQSLRSIRIIEGTPAVAAELMRALVLRAGHQLWPEDQTVTSCTFAGRRAGEDQTSRVTWTMDDARRAGLAGKPNWRTYPRQMLTARTSAELCRMIFADVIGGLMAIEELEGADSGATPAAALPEVQATAAVPSSTRRRRRSPSATVSTPPPAIPAPPIPGEPGQPMSTAQRRKMMALYGDLHLTGAEHRAERIAHGSAIIGRQIASANDLTADEASQIIEAISTELEAPFSADADAREGGSGADDASQGSAAAPGGGQPPQPSTQADPWPGDQGALL